MKLGTHLRDRLKRGTDHTPDPFPSTIWSRIDERVSAAYVRLDPAFQPLAFPVVTGVNTFCEWRNCARLLSH
ncbi:MAG: hypothetical protein AAB691_03665 [Patescibacteria group bacterium]